MSEKVALLINGKRFVFWTEVSIDRAIDTVSGIVFRAPFDYTAADFKENFSPFSYNPVSITVNDETLFTGTMMDVNPELSPDGKTIQVSCYSKCGVLQDCTAPVEALPLEFNNLNLRDIATKLAGYFKINVVFKEDPGPVFQRVACDPDKKIFDFLTELAKQRGFVISSDENGDLLFWKSATGLPVAVLRQGESPLQTVTPTFNPQEYYSDLTGLAPVEVDKAPAKKTVKTKKEKKDKTAAPKKPAKTPKPPKKYQKFSVAEDTEVFRPLSFKIDDIEGADVETATKAKLARMLGNMASYEIKVATWRDSYGKLWTPNTKIRLFAPDAFIYEEFEFEIKSVSLSQSEENEDARLVVCLPGSFSGEPPEVFPWEL